jgi:hypothetical protein
MPTSVSVPIKAGPERAHVHLVALGEAPAASRHLLRLLVLLAVADHVVTDSGDTGDGDQAVHHALLFAAAFRSAMSRWYSSIPPPPGAAPNDMCPP